ncbi:MAG: hypothetical protein A2945_03615 [Candidatus Liptonbacteria bacterium RIFCSPLOWO2_01_FULL_52_25]|uniref:Exonuclease domain-containing protein n=1 Tax=Candidatus Liptonbacteria bacterium RIFCSPLOWO2_01_FULL_52_25 TaxID=1798650 RepID=A0A1G2CG89_9BACT|nr:MAG: hypothetical protein A2945_03615 [Candidatus Liptonbacteria bacterium RIFCSPLOWO2_01_FULL_52_25]
MEYPLLFLDLETTGHDPVRRIGDHLVPWHEIIDIGALFVDEKDLSIVGKFSEKVTPEHPERCLPNLVNHYPERAARGEWDEAISLDAAIGQLFDFVRSYAAGTAAIPGGQNWFFDWNFLSVAFAWCGVSENTWKKHIHYTRFDTRSMAIQELLRPGEGYDPDAFSLRNGRLLERLGIPPEPEVHEGLNGALKSFEIYKKLRELRALRDS